MLALPERGGGLALPLAWIFLEDLLSKITKTHIKITKIMRLFSWKIMCLEKPKMLNKYYFFLSFWESQLSRRVGGGGSSQLGQNPNFDRKLVLEAPLIIYDDLTVPLSWNIIKNNSNQSLSKSVTTAPRFGTWGPIADDEHSDHHLWWPDHKFVMKHHQKQQ